MKVAVEYSVYLLKPGHVTVDQALHDQALHLNCFMKSWVGG